MTEVLHLPWFRLWQWYTSENMQRFVSEEQVWRLQGVEGRLNVIWMIPVVNNMCLRLLHRHCTCCVMPLCAQLWSTAGHDWINLNMGLAGQVENNAPAAESRHRFYAPVNVINGLPYSLLSTSSRTICNISYVSYYGGSRSHGHSIATEPQL